MKIATRTCIYISTYLYKYTILMYILKHAYSRAFYFISGIEFVLPLDYRVTSVGRNYTGVKALDSKGDIFERCQIQLSCYVCVLVCVCHIYFDTLLSV